MPKRKKFAAYFPDSALILLFSAGFLLLFSSSTSPLHPNTYGADSAFYRFLGTMICKGKVLYKDVWDNKGPLLFFIQALGALKGTKNADLSLIFILQIISLTVSGWFALFTYREINGQKNHSVFFALFFLNALAVFGKTIESGNLSEEWCLPFISCSLYCFAKYADQSQNHPCHPKKYAFIHGICLASIAFIRINNAVSIFAGLLTVCIFLIRKREWKNLSENLLTGLIGIAAVILPIFIYFISKSALRDMLYAVFGYNLKYTAHGNSHDYFGMEDMLQRFLPIASSFGIILISVIRSRTVRFIDLLAFTVSAVNGIMLWNSNIYLHYFTVYIPVFLFVLILYVHKHNIPGILIVCLVLAFFICRDFEVISGTGLPDQTPEHYPFAASIPEEEKDSAIAVWVSPEIYLNSGIIPVSRYCAYQFIHFGVDPGMKEEFLHDLREKQPKWIILLKGYEDLYDPEIRELVNRKYAKVWEERDVSYFRISE